MKLGIAKFGVDIAVSGPPKIWVAYLAYASSFLTLSSQPRLQGSTTQPCWAKRPAGWLPVIFEGSEHVNGEGVIDLRRAVVQLGVQPAGLEIRNPVEVTLENKTAKRVILETTVFFASLNVH